jgi:hypothetical protein
MQNDETTPKYVGYDEDKLQEMKTTERKRISKIDAKQSRCESDLNLKPKAKDIQLTLKSKCDAIKTSVIRFSNLS